MPPTGPGVVWTSLFHASQLTARKWYSRHFGRHGFCSTSAPLCTGHANLGKNPPYGFLQSEPINSLPMLWTCQRRIRKQKLADVTWLKGPEWALGQSAENTLILHAAQESPKWIAALLVHPRKSLPDASVVPLHLCG